ncbi:pentatricopeptide repeat (PPR) superfamily protein [Wolffia australiana]
MKTELAKLLLASGRKTRIRFGADLYCKSSLSQGRFYGIPPRRPAKEQEAKDQSSEDLFLRNLKFGDRNAGEDGKLAGNGGDDDRPESFLLQKLKLGLKTDEQTPPIKKIEDDPPLSDSSAQDADGIFRKMKETGLIPNAVAMLDGLCKDGLIQEAMKLFGVMREKGAIPEVVIYTAVVEGFCKAAKFDDAKRIFRKMQNNGISPNAFSYKILIEGLLRGRRMEDSVEVSLEMLDVGHSLTVGTFTELIDQLCKINGVEKAAGVVRRLREKGLAIEDRVIREHLDKKGPSNSQTWEAIFGKKMPHQPL